MPETGDNPGIGSYMCKGCGYIISLTNQDDALPACPRCGKTEYFNL